MQGLVQWQCNRALLVIGVSFGSRRIASGVLLFHRVCFLSAVVMTLFQLRPSRVASRD